MDWVTQIIQKAEEDKFCGKIEINMFQGGVANINVSESIKPPMNWKGSLVVKNWKQPQP